MWSNNLCCLPHKAAGNKSQIVMNPADLLGKSFACECGKTHALATRDIVYAESVVRRLPAILAANARGRKVALFDDARTDAAAGAACRSALAEAGWTTQHLLVADGPHDGPVCDDRTRDELMRRLQPADILLAVGSGVINDLTKWIARETRLPYVVVATAASMNGYTSNNIAPTIRGVKRVVDGAVPLAVLADPDVIAGAPYKLTASGLGDVLAKPVSMTDWRLNHLLFGEYYCAVCAQLIRSLESGYLEHPEAILARQPEAIRSLFFALLYSGVSMTLAGTSFPASGGEHMISHVLDMTAAIQGVNHDYHGRQVGLGTIFACALYERIMALDSPRFQFHAEPTDANYWKELTTVVEEEHVLKRRKAERAAQRFTEDPGLWDKLRAELKPMTRPAADIKRCLKMAGAAHRIEDIGCTRERFLDAALHSHQMRERYTIIDLSRAAGILPAAAGEIVDEYLT